MAERFQSATFEHGTAPRFGVLLANLGTPDEPTTAAVRRYLAEFLSDPRVVEIPPLVWKFILHGVILRTRPAKSAAKYQKIWMKDGSPLLVWSARQAQLLQGTLGERLRAQQLDPAQMKVALGMRYGKPSIARAMDELVAAGCDRILVLPLYPQYAASTTASLMDCVYAHAMTLRNQPAIRSVRTYHDDDHYIDAMVRHIHRYWERNGRPEVLLLSFHGVPKFALDKGDPYHCYCLKTARLISERLKVSPEVRTSFQSRFGKTEWLKPYTSDVLVELGKAGTRRVDVFCPGFPADCLETLEEIAIEGKETFTIAGGKEFSYIPALNDSGEWIEALADIALSQLGGWLGKRPSHEALMLSRNSAKGKGASR